MSDARDALLDLCGWLDVDLGGLADDTLDLIALRIVADDVKPDAIGALVEQVRFQERAEAGENARPGQPLVKPASAHRSKFKFNSTEATEAKMRHRLSLVHSAEDRRTALNVHPRRPDRLGPLAVHPPCKSAYQDGGTCCSRCAPLLHPADCDCSACDYFEGVQE